MKRGSSVQDLSVQATLMLQQHQTDALAIIREFIESIKRDIASSESTVGASASTSMFDDIDDF